MATAIETWDSSFSYCYDATVTPGTQQSNDHSIITASISIPDAGFLSWCRHLPPAQKPSTTAYSYSYHDIAIATATAVILVDIAIATSTELS